MTGTAARAGTPSPAAAAFGHRVRELRLERGWGLRHLGSLTFLDKGTLSRIERGADTTLGTAERISGAFGMSLPVMIDPDSCPVCHDAPPRGLICGTCDAKGPEVTR